MIYALLDKKAVNDNEQYCRESVAMAMDSFIEQLKMFYDCPGLNSLTNAEFLDCQIATFELTFQEFKDGKI